MVFHFFVDFSFSISFLYVWVALRSPFSRLSFILSVISRRRTCLAFLIMILRLCHTLFRSVCASSVFVVMVVTLLACFSMCMIVLLVDLLPRPVILMFQYLSACAAMFGAVLARGRCGFTFFPYLHE